MPLRFPWRGGRVAEGNGLLNRRRCQNLPRVRISPSPQTKPARIFMTSRLFCLWGNTSSISSKASQMGGSISGRLTTFLLGSNVIMLADALPHETKDPGCFAPSGSSTPVLKLLLKNVGSKQRKAHSTSFTISSNFLQLNSPNLSLLNSADGTPIAIGA